MSNKRVGRCQACSFKERGVKTRISIPHTCGDYALFFTESGQVTEHHSQHVAQKEQPEQDWNQFAQDLSHLMFRRNLVVPFDDFQTIVDFIKEKTTLK